MKKAFILTFFLLLISSLLVGCTEKPNESTNDDGKKMIYTTVYPLQYLTKRIAGDLAKVDTIYPPGADEHTFEPSQRDMMNVADADIFFFIGLGLEGFVEKAKTTLEKEEVQFIAVGEKVHLEDSAEDHEEGHEEEGHDVSTEHEESAHEEEHDEHNHGDVDPHVWLDPIYTRDLALAIKDSLVLQLPEEEKTLQENYEELSKELENLHMSFQKTIENAQHKDIIVSHAAFGYWEKRYGLNQISISGLTTSMEPSQKDLEEIVKIAKEKDLKYVLFEQNVSSKLGKIIQNEVGAKSLSLHNLSILSEENIQNNDTYFTLMEQNLETLSKALNE